MALTEKPSTGGQTTFGSDKEGPHVLAVNCKTGFASGIALVDSAGTEYILYIDTTGDLRIGTRANFATPNAAGTVVGSQS